MAKIYLFFVCICFVSLYLFTLRGFTHNTAPNTKLIYAGSPFESSLERGRYAQAISLATEKSFAVNKYASFVSPDVAWYGGNYYPAFPPGTAVTLIPFYLLGNQFGFNQAAAYFTMAFFSLLTSLVIFACMRTLHFGLSRSLLACAIYLFGSVAWVYSSTISAHPISAFLISSSFLIYLHLGNSYKKNFILFSLLWIIFGLNLFVDYPNLVILLPIIIAACLKTIYRKDENSTYRIIIPLYSAYAFLGFILIVSLYSFFSFKQYKQPFVFTNKYNLQLLSRQGISIVEKNLSNDLFKKKSYGTRFEGKNILTGIQVLLFSTDRGLFIYSPIFILSFIGIICSFFIPLEGSKVVIFVFLTNLLFYSTFDDPWGGWSFGPRYLIPSLPLMAIMAAYAIDVIKKKVLVVNVISSILLFYSIGIALLGAITTSLIPPSVEKTFDNLPSNYSLNWIFLNSGKTSSVLYHAFVYKLLPPVSYYALLLVIASFLAIFFIWFGKPRLTYYES